MKLILFSLSLGLRSDGLETGHACSAMPPDQDQIADAAGMHVDDNVCSSRNRVGSLIAYHNHLNSLAADAQGEIACSGDGADMRVLRLPSAALMLSPTWTISAPFRRVRSLAADFAFSLAHGGFADHQASYDIDAGCEVGYRELESR